jgi:hypothetical protein
MVATRSKVSILKDGRASSGNYGLFFVFPVLHKILERLTDKMNVIFYTNTVTDVLPVSQCSVSCGNIVGIATAYVMHDRRVEVRVPVGSTQPPFNAYNGLFHRG